MHTYVYLCACFYLYVHCMSLCRGVCDTCVLLSVESRAMRVTSLQTLLQTTHTYTHTHLGLGGVAACSCHSQSELANLHVNEA